MPLSTKHEQGRCVVIAEASRGNNYRVLSAYTAGLEFEFRRRGWDVSVARAGTPEFLPTLLQHAADTSAVALLGHFFYDLRVAAQNHFSGARIGDLFRGRLCAMWADHPFTWFMAPRMQEADPRVVYFPAEPGFVDAAAVVNPQLKRFHPLSLPVLYLPDAPPQPLSKRQIDVLVPLTFRDTGTRDRYLAELVTQPRLRRIAEALFARLRDDRMNYPFVAFHEVMRAEFGIPESELAAARDLLPDTLGVLSKVDLIVRNERRVELVEDLLRDSAGLRVHVAGWLPPELKLPGHAVCEGPLDVAELGRRMAQTRWVVHCHPTYPRAMHERVLTAMATGCGVISDFAPALAETFEQGDEWLYAPPGAGIRALTAVFEDECLEALGTAAMRAVRDRFEMPQHVDGLLAGLDAEGAR